MHAAEVAQQAYACRLMSMREILAGLCAQGVGTGVIQQETQSAPRCGTVLIVGLTLFRLVDNWLTRHSRPFSGWSWW
eukprot:351711-Pelagomonas_calceolata.AAC.1